MPFPLGSSTSDALVVALARAWIRYAPTDRLKWRLWELARGRDCEYVARTRHGFRVKGRSIDMVQGYLYFFGTWEPNLTAWLSSRFREMEGRLFLDVGANVGYYSLLAHRLMPHDAGVIAIEASPRIHRMLDENVRLNHFDRIRTINVAATAERGTLRLFHGPVHNLGRSSTEEPVGGDSGGVEVPGLPLADVLTSIEFARVRVVKIDVEGAEASVLKGLAPVLDRLPLDVEFVVEIAAERPGNMDTVLATLAGRGFNLYRLVNSYDPAHYMRPWAVERPRRIRGVPTQGGDYVFSRQDLETL
jgi:FkbM family methyltransferase